ncbi:hypothetical protein WH357_21230 [Enterobacter ludwigii]
MNKFLITSCINRQLSRDFISHCQDVFAFRESSIQIILNEVNDFVIDDFLFIYKFIGHLKENSVVVHIHATGILDVAAFIFYLNGSVRSMESNSKFMLNNKLDSLLDLYDEYDHIRLNDIITNTGRVIAMDSFLSMHDKITACAALELGISDMVTNY